MQSAEQLLTAVSDRDATTLRRLIVETQFALIRIKEDNEDMHLLTTEIDDNKVLVAFTSETLAIRFINGLTDPLTKEVHHFIVDGESLL